MRIPQSLSFWVLSLLLPSTASAQDPTEAIPDPPPTPEHGVYIVDIRDPIAPDDELAARVCAGLFNREEHLDGGGTPVYLLESTTDEEWLLDTGVVEGDSTQVVQDASMTATEFLPICLANREVVKGYIRYSFSAQRAILPIIVTLAAVLDAVPLWEFAPVSLATLQLRQGPTTKSAVSEWLEDNADLPLLLDASAEFQGMEPLEVTRYVFNEYGQETTAMAMMNPGYQPVESDLDNIVPEDWGFPQALNPELVPGTENLGLTDFVIQQRLFAFFLWFGCVDGDPEEELVSFMANPNNNNWPNPIPVYGYNTAFRLFEGLVFEANTNCADSNNMGSIPSINTNNLSFFSRVTAPSASTQTTNSPDITYDPTKTYISFVIGDGDNVEFVKTTRREWMQERVDYCDGDQRPQCYPLMWSMSPHIGTLAPEMWQWYQDQAQAATDGLDTFILPPSGHLYAYPTQMGPDAQAEFVRKTEEAALNFDTNGLVAWEWVGTWPDAFSNYFPRYLQEGIVTAVLAMNVPYPIPIVSTPFFDSYRLVGNQMAVFNSLIWRGTDERDPREFHLSTRNFADQINNFPRGYVNFVYTSSDGGYSISDLHDLIPLLDDHVEIVDSKQLASVALQRGDPPSDSPLDDLVDTLNSLPDVLNDLVDGILRSASSSKESGSSAGKPKSNPDNSFGF